MSDDAAARTSVTLLGRLCQGADDHSAWDEFVSRYAPRIYGWCRQWKLQDADARDVTQNVLLKLAARMRNFEYDRGRSFRAWLKTVTRHAWMDYLTGQDRPGRGSGDTDVHGMLQTLPAAEGLIEALKEAFDLEIMEEAQERVRGRVEPHTWEAFRLTAVDGHAVPATAAGLGMSVAAVYKAKNRVLQLLKQEVQRLEAATE